MAANETKNALGKLTMLEAKSLLVKNKDNLTQEMKDAILEALTKDVHTSLAEARQLWAKKKALSKEQSALLLEWIWTQVDHTKIGTEKLALVTKTEAVPAYSLFGGAPISRPYYGTTSMFGAPAKVCAEGLFISPTGVIL